MGWIENTRRQSKPWRGVTVDPNTGKRVTHSFVSRKSAELWWRIAEAELSPADIAALNAEG